MYLAVTCYPAVEVAENGDTRQPDSVPKTALSRFFL
jgi:hypothetical protein